MKKDVMISIKGVYDQDGDLDTVELLTTGQYYHKNGSFYIVYEESEATGFEGAKTTVKLSPDQSVTMMRSGTAKAQLIIQKGVRHQCHYDTGFGPMMIGVSGDCVDSSLTEEGGSLAFGYSLDIDTMLTSENKVFIEVKNC